MIDFDLVVVGGGTANNVASGAARKDLDVALVEKRALGGTCLTRGCDPSKVLVHRADLVRQIRDAEAFGIEAEIADIDFGEIVSQSNDPFAEKAAHMESEMRELDDLTLYKGEGRFVDERTIEVDGERLRGEKVVIAAGARPVIPSSIDGIDDVDYVTSDEVLSLDEFPDRLVVIGGGYVAAEIGHVYGELGSDVSIVGRSESLLPNEDEDVREAFTEAFSRRHDVNTGYEATAVSQDGEEITVHAKRDDGEGGDASEGSDEAEELEITGDELLVATGRRPNADVLQVDEAGIATDGNGFVEVNDSFETTAENVWALGDVVGNPMFWHAARYEAEVVYRNVVHDRREEANYAGMSHAVFSAPQVASLGRTEEELVEDGREYDVGRYEYGDAAMGIAMKEDDGFVKVLADPDDGEILGCHVLGPDASTLVHEVVVAVATGSGTVSDVTDAIHVHPALSEVVERAFRDV